MLLDFNKLYKKYNFKINGVIHIGAHIGQELSTYKKYNISNIVFFEALPRTFKKLQEHVKDQALIYNYGVGDENCVLEMNVEAVDKWGCSSFLTPSSNYPPSTFSGKQEIEVRTLDSFNFEPKYNFLNIDVQGFELKVFKGAKNYLNNVDYIICEVHRHTTAKPLDYVEAPVIEEITEYLSPYGFELKEAKWAGKSWGDALYIKNKL